MNLQTYRGSCHCQLIQFTVSAPPTLEVDRCNCSICSKSGYLHLIVPQSKFKITQGKEHLQTYTFGSMIARHTFCKVCGIKPFYIPRSNPDGISINANCLDPTPDAMIIHDFDGQNWAKNAHKLSHKSRD